MSRIATNMNLAADTEVRVAGMIAVKHRTFAFFLRDRRNKEMIVNLNFHRAKPRSDFTTQGFAIDNVSALSPRRSRLW